MKAQLSLELMLWACAGMLFFSASLLAFGEGFSRMNSAKAGLEMQEFLAFVFASADSVGEHGSRVGWVNVPQGITGFASGELGSEWWASFSRGNATWNRTLPYRLVVQPADLLFSPGRHAVRISRGEGAVFVERI